MFSFLRKLSFCNLGLHKWVKVDWDARYQGFQMMAVPYRHECKRCEATK